MSEPAGAVARGMTWTMASAGVQVALQLITLGVLGRLLTPADFGLVAAALVIVNFSAIFSQLGLNQAIIQRRTLTPGVSATAFLVSMCLALVLAALLVAAAPAIAALLILPDVAPILRSLAAIFVVRALAATSEALLVRGLRFRVIALVDILSYGLGYALVGIALAASGAGVWSLVGAQLSQAGIKSIMILAVQRHGIRPDLDPVVLRSMLRFGSGHSLARIANFVALQADNLVVARGLGAPALGVYSRAYQLMGMPAALVGNAIDKVLFPSLSRLQDDRPALGRSYLRGVTLIALLTVPVGVVLSATAPEIVPLLLGSGWEGVVAPFQIFALTMVFRVSDRLNAVVTRATAAVYRRALLQTVYAGMVVGAATVALPFGVRGVALGVAAALAINHALSTTLTLALVGGRWRDAVAALVAATPLTLVAGGTAVAVATGLRALDVGTAPTLAGTLLATMMLSLLCLVAAPRSMLGPDAPWILETASSLLPRRLRRPRRASDARGRGST